VREDLHQPRGTNILLSFRRIEALSRTFAVQFVRANGHHGEVTSIPMAAAWCWHGQREADSG
jgi:hypothetical protein